MRLASWFAVGSSCLVVSGCSGCEGETPKEPPESAGHAPRNGPKLQHVRDGGAGFRAMRMRLEEEHRARPAVALPIEALFEAYAKEGIVLDRTRQQLAAPFQATYCMSAHTGSKVKLTVCEHESEERADDNVKASQKLERPERRIAKNGTTTLSVRRDLNDDSEAPLVDKLLRSFEQLGTNHDR